MRLYAGIDVGSISTDVVILDSEANLITSGVSSTGANGKTAAGRLLSNLLNSVGRKKSELEYIVATGYGRNLVEPANKKVTEITCHGIGAKHFFDETDSILDIGGQDCKAIKISPAGIIEDFQMNDKCAAGSGRFLEVMASALETDLAGLNKLYFHKSKTEAINATCTVFAESEVISKLSEGIEPAAIVKGIFKTIAERAVHLLNAIQPIRSLTLSGGVSKNPALVEEIKLEFKGKVNIPNDPQITGALGAALLALREKNEG